jgi:propionyl-CoA synthetase
MWSSVATRYQDGLPRQAGSMTAPFSASTAVGTWDVSTETSSPRAALATRPAVAECAVIGIHDDLKGEVPYGLVVLKAGAQPDPGQLRDELVAAVRRDVGPVAAFREVSVVSALPKIRSGKVLRKTMRAIANGKDEPVPATIEDASVLDALTPVLRSRQ